MQDYLNYWLKKMVKETPNDSDLGSKIRKMCWEESEDQTQNKDERGDDWVVDQYNRNRKPEEWVKSREDIKYIFERNPDTGEVRKRKIK
tara:strand:- start:117 stop:383 length:267 start_codon:yes stop_codon:yes gene_type:complete